MLLLERCSTLMLVEWLDLELILVGEHDDDDDDDDDDGK
jgi:endogenous inhibitor of DNA gyrase (YacG/DUF329 family)